LGWKKQREAPKNNGGQSLEKKNWEKDPVRRGFEETTWAELGARGRKKGGVSKNPGDPGKLKKKGFPKEKKNSAEEKDNRGTQEKGPQILERIGCRLILFGKLVVFFLHTSSRGIRVGEKGKMGGEPWVALWGK